MTEKSISVVCAVNFQIVDARSRGSAWSRTNDMTTPPTNLRSRRRCRGGPETGPIRTNPTIGLTNDSGSARLRVQDETEAHIPYSRPGVNPAKPRHHVGARRPGSAPGRRLSEGWNSVARKCWLARLRDRTARCRLSGGHWIEAFGEMRVRAPPGPILSQASVKQSTTKSGQRAHCAPDPWPRSDDLAPRSSYNVSRDHARSASAVGNRTKNGFPGIKARVVPAAQTSTPAHSSRAQFPSRVGPRGKWAGMPGAKSPEIQSILHNAFCVAPALHNADDTTERTEG